MKTTRFALLGLLLAAVVCQRVGWLTRVVRVHPGDLLSAPTPPPTRWTKDAGWPISTVGPGNGGSGEPSSGSDYPGNPGSGGRAGRDPRRIFNYVHDHIRYVLYFGSKKGAALTLLKKSGNDFDQSALLVVLLRAAGHTNVAYPFGCGCIYPTTTPTVMIMICATGGGQLALVQRRLDGPPHVPGRFAESARLSRMGRRWMTGTRCCCKERGWR